MVRNRVGIGIVFIFVGFLYLMIQLGVVSTHTVWLTGPVLWPLCLVAWGGFGLHRISRRGIPWFSLFLIFFGLTLIVKNSGTSFWLNHISYTGLFWSLVIIFFGASLMTPGNLNFYVSPFSKTTFRKGKAKRMSVDSNKETRKSNSHTNWSFMGDVSIGGHPWVMENMTLSHGLGDVRVNLATAHVEEGSYEIEIQCLAGDIRVIIPRSLDVCIDAHIGLGDIQVFGDEEYSGISKTVHVEDPEYASSSRKCYICMSLKLGDIEIMRV